MSGIKHDKEKLRMDLLPVEAMEGLAQVLSFGAQKYGDRNWEEGLAYGRVYGALLRHMTTWWKGEGKDPETGLSHLHHAAACIAFLQTYEARGMVELDNRPIYATHPKPVLYE